MTRRANVRGSRFSLNVSRKAHTRDLSDEGNARRASRGVRRRGQGLGQLGSAHVTPENLNGRVKTRFKLRFDEQHSKRDGQPWRGQRRGRYALGRADATVA